MAFFFVEEKIIVQHQANSNSLCIAFVEAQILGDA